MPRKRSRDRSAPRPPPLIPGSRSPESAAPSTEGDHLPADGDLPRRDGDTGAEAATAAQAPAAPAAEPPAVAAPAPAPPPAAAPPPAPPPAAAPPAAAAPAAAAPAAAAPPAVALPFVEVQAPAAPAAEPPAAAPAAAAPPAVELPFVEAPAAATSPAAEPATAPPAADPSAVAPASAPPAVDTPRADAHGALPLTEGAHPALASEPDAALIGSDAGTAVVPDTDSVAATPETEAETEPAPVADPARLIPGSALIGVVVGLWAVAPNFTGPGLVLQDPSVEVVDHVVPGLIVVATSIVALVVAWSAPRPRTVLFLSGGVVAAAGLWMVATHVPLLLQAVQGSAPWGATLYHLAPSVAVLWLGLAWTARYWSTWVDPPA